MAVDLKHPYNAILRQDLLFWLFRFSLVKSLQVILTVRNSSCGKVMFSQACVKNSVHRGGINPPRLTPPRHTHNPHPTMGRPPSQTHTPLGRHLPWADSPLDGHCSRRYTSYWNAFLLQNSFHFDNNLFFTVK